MQLNFGPLVLLCSATLLFGACQKEESLEKGLRSTEFDLTEVNGSGISGKVLFSENKDSSFNVLVTLNTSLLDSLHAVRIYNGRIDSAGPVAIPLTSILGNGVAAHAETRDIREASLPDGLVIPMTYDGILSFKGFVGVHLSETRMDSLISHGNIGE